MAITKVTTYIERFDRERGDWKRTGKPPVKQLYPPIRRSDKTKVEELPELIYDFTRRFIIQGRRGVLRDKNQLRAYIIIKYDYLEGLIPVKTKRYLIARLVYNEPGKVFEQLDGKYLDKYDVIGNKILAREFEL